MATETRLLFVCLGNICRSPAAEAVFLNLLEKDQLQDRFLVDSAGIGGWHVGRAADPRMRAAAERRGIQLASRARQLEPADLRRFDHILTMDASNQAAVMGLARKTRGSMARIEPLVHYLRVMKADQVPDPYGGGPAGFEHVLDLLEDACRGLLEALR
ncbi:MAG: low molecular weight protein-tyrosine-phosphatase [Cyanobacteriota bacterium]|jgi:protein-tyrosine phosphatase|nr:low molecular weight protein-tyrosine-phosphatase [Cyanobacteriota bacterium]